MIDITDTLQAKSDQLNSDDIISGPITVKITKVNKTRTDQPITINYEGDQGRPFKPCKTVRRILSRAWGTDASKWIGRLMTLYCEPSVKWAGKEIGGIRVSHLSHINETLQIKLSETRGMKKPHTVHPLKTDAQTHGAPPTATSTEDLGDNAPNIVLKKTDGSEIKFDNFQAWLNMIETNVPKMSNLDRLDTFDANHKAIFEDLEEAGWNEWVDKARAIINNKRTELGGNTDGEL